MYDKEMEDLIDAALMDGILEDYEKEALLKKADQLGIDRGELMMVVNSRLQKMEQEKMKESDSRKPRKCPKCGAVIESHMVECPECGYAFDASANKSSKELAEKILAVGSITELNVSNITQIITTFPVPNTKSDLLEFVTALTPRIFPSDKTNINIRLAESYRIKLEECVNKISLSFPNDKLFASFMETWADKKSQSEKACRVNIFEKILFFIKENIVWLLNPYIGIPVALLVLFIGWKSCSVVSGYIDNSRFESALEEGRWKEAEAIADSKRSIFGKDEYYEKSAKIRTAKEQFRNKLNSEFSTAVKNNDLDTAITLFVNNFDFLKGNTVFYEAVIVSNRTSEIEGLIDTDESRPSYEVEPFYIMVITNLCEQGKIDEASKYIDNKILTVHKSDYLKEEYLSVINKYKKKKK